MPALRMRRVAPKRRADQDIVVRIKRPRDDPPPEELVIDRSRAIRRRLRGPEGTLRMRLLQTYDGSERESSATCRLPAPPPEGALKRRREVESETVHPAKRGVQPAAGRKRKYEQVCGPRRTDSHTLIELAAVYGLEQEAAAAAAAAASESVYDVYVPVDDASLLDDAGYCQSQEVVRFGFDWSDFEDCAPDSREPELNEDGDVDSEDSLNPRFDYASDEDDDDDGDEEGAAAAAPPDADDESSYNDSDSARSDGMHRPFDLGDGYDHYGDGHEGMSGARRMRHLLRTYDREVVDDCGMF
eukprot:TRINITY_DN8928_c0_g1_i1.p1 TRINITY_DN8928_c0_g1~~TRINITY_DN8928_c0_g1_i1.p1  ORF type:complete len:300 (+),score=78.93 TRINITY_DN8928_c0_g1_i1:81-980(+)